MHSDSLPIIRVEIESIKSQIQSYMGYHGSELGDAVSKAIDSEFLKATANIPKQIENIVNICLDDMIRQELRKRICEILKDNINLTNIVIGLGDKKYEI